MKISNGEYSIIHEASGLINLISILVAIYDDEIEVLLIDEPEVSLHPQLQSYLLHEIKTAIRITGKTVVLSTHSTEMIDLKNIEDLTNIVFFANNQKPIQIELNNEMLKNKKLNTFITVTIGHTHKKAFFARKVFLIEGPSDETICKFLVNKLNINIDVAGTEIIMVNGKNNFAPIIKFFKLIGKEVVILTDLDGLIDDNEIINIFNDSEIIQKELIKNGCEPSIIQLTNSIKTKFNELLTNDKAKLKNIYEQHPYYRLNEECEDTKIKRAMLGKLMSINDTDIKQWNNYQEWEKLKGRFIALFKYLRKAGCFVLEKGSIESYYHFSPKDTYTDKINVSYDEIVELEKKENTFIEAQYKEIVDALKYAADLKEVDESYAIKKEILSELSLVVYMLV